MHPWHWEKYNILLQLSHARQFCKNAYVFFFPLQHENCSSSSRSSIRWRNRGYNSSWRRSLSSYTYFVHACVFCLNSSILNHIHMVAKFFTLFLFLLLLLRLDISILCTCVPLTSPVSLFLSSSVVGEINKCELYSHCRPIDRWSMIGKWSQYSSTYVRVYWRSIDIYFF